MADDQPAIDFTPTASIKATQPKLEHILANPSRTYSPPPAAPKLHPSLSVCSQSISRQSQDDQFSSSRVPHRQLRNTSSNFSLSSDQKYAFPHPPPSCPAGKLTSSPAASLRPSARPDKLPAHLDSEDDAPRRGGVAYLREHFASKAVPLPCPAPKSAPYKPVSRVPLSSQSVLNPEYTRSDESFDSSDEHLDSSDEPFDQSDEPFDPSDEPLDPSNESFDQSNEPSGPSDEPLDPYNEFSGPSDEPLDPSDEPFDYTERISKIIRDEFKDIPVNLIDTCLGVIVDTDTMISDFKKLDEYQRIEASFSNGGEVGMRHLLKSHFEYAMLSHRWNDTETTKEPTYAFIKSAQDKGQNIYDMKEQFSNGKDWGENMRKLRSFCYTAAKCGFRWAWSDTCCINKASRIEEEASINSMFKWYSNSALTIVYLRDVLDVTPINRLGLHTSNSVHDFVAKHHAGSQKAPILQYAQEQHGEEFVDTQVDENALENLLKQYFPVFDGKSSPRPEWCVRCWTLPEMVASRHLRFYCKTWKALEPASYPRASRTKRFSDHRQSLLWQGALSRSTGVDAENLLHFKPGMMNVREKLHWASRREATRDEDLAYSLLGLFGIKMSVIYGEGLDAFVRLQEEIMKRTDDLSIFDFSGAVSGVNSCLAFSPSCYSEGPLERMERKMTLGRFFGGALSVLGAVTPALFDRFKTFLESNSGLPPGHSLGNGTITVSVFEHKVKLEKIASHKYKYSAKTNGLSQTEFTTLEPLKLEDGPAYYLIRVYDRQVRRAIEIVASHAMYWIKDKLDQGLVGREEGRERARGFLEDPFVVYLMARDGESCRRVATKSRIIVHYRAYRFSQAVRRRTLT